MDHSKKYERGYVPGVFDLFHIGHLNLLKNASERCRYLIAGILTDELVEYFKGKPPVIPFEERMAIVQAIRYVDETVSVNFENTFKMDAWRQLHFDCHFSGSDHGPEWEEERQKLRAVGSEMEFLPYTKGISSSSLRRQLDGTDGQEKLFLFGAGLLGNRFLERLWGSPQADRWQVVGFLDNAPGKRGSRMMGLPVYSPEELRLIAPDGFYTVVITSRAVAEIREQLVKMGVQKIISIEDFF